MRVRKLQFCRQLADRTGNALRNPHESLSTQEILVDVILFSPHFIIKTMWMWTWAAKKCLSWATEMDKHGHKCVLLSFWTVAEGTIPCQLPTTQPFPLKQDPLFLTHLNGVPEGPSSLLLQHAKIYTRITQTCLQQERIKHRWALLMWRRESICFPNLQTDHAWICHCAQKKQVSSD